MPLPTCADFGDIVITQEFCEIFTKEFVGTPRWVAHETDESMSATFTVTDCGAPLYEKAKLVGDTEIVGASSTGVISILKFALVLIPLLRVRVTDSVPFLLRTGVIRPTQFGAVPEKLALTRFPVDRPICEHLTSESTSLMVTLTSLPDPSSKKLREMGDIRIVGASGTSVIFTLTVALIDFPLLNVKSNWSEPDLFIRGLTLMLQGEVVPVFAAETKP
jgi:hypothetical protein